MPIAGTGRGVVYTLVMSNSVLSIAMLMVSGTDPAIGFTIIRSVSKTRTS